MPPSRWFAPAAPAETAGQPARADHRLPPCRDGHSSDPPACQPVCCWPSARSRAAGTDPITGRIDPWPWATNHAGEGHYFASAPEAITWVAAQQASGIRSIDVGCFQVNLHYHPDAFAGLAEAFDPAANARYAAALPEPVARTKRELALGDRPLPLGRPVEGQRYSAASWTSGIPAAGSRASLAGGLQSGNPVVVRPAMASAVRVVVPNWTTARSLATVSNHAAGLPRVITPSR